MSRTIPKTSQAVFYSARLNPVHDKERQAIDIIESWKSDGFNFKEGVVDAILRSRGITPEMFTRRDMTAQYFASLTEDVLKRFAQELMDTLRQSGMAAPALTSATDEAEVLTPFTKTFVNGLKQRQQQSFEDE